MTIEEAVPALAARQGNYQLYSQYYSGIHRPVLSSEKWRNTFGLRMRGFRDNLCPAVVDAVADRLQLTGFDKEGEADKTGPRSEVKAPETLAAMEIWRRNRMDKNAGHVHLEALRIGDSYVMVWPDVKGDPRLRKQEAHEIAVDYNEDDPDVIDSAAKGWFDTDSVDSTKQRFRLVLYFPDRIEKYITRDAVDQAPKDSNAYQENPGDGETWPLVNPYGVVPVFHFANNSCSGYYGNSELHDVIPIQDALNKAMGDLLIALEFVSLQQRYIIGSEVDIDDATGRPKQQFNSGTDTIWTFMNENTKVGAFPQADLSHHLNAISEFRAEIARVSGTPLHYMMLLGGAPPSGEALKTLEARLIKKVKDRSIAFGNVWEDVMSFALKIQGQSDVRFNSTWTDPAPRSELEHAQTLQIKSAIGVPEEKLLEELDYTAEEIAQMQAQKAKEKQQTFNQQMALTQARPAPQGPPRTGGAPQNAG